jgi:site-specific DNA-methyltransferase (adenine-specific)
MMVKLNSLSKEEWAKHNYTIWNCASYNGYLASFDNEIPRRLIKYFSFEGDNILDPFVGSGTTLIESKKLGRNSYGVDCSKKAVDIANGKLSEIKTSSSISKIYHADSRRLDFLGDIEFDLIITSPPYYNIIEYSKDKEQIGNIKNYDDFINNTMEVLKSATSLLKKGKYFCIITGDIRKKDNYYPIHVDYINNLSKFDLELNQIIINIFKTSGKGKREDCMGYPSNFHPWMIHEYILIFKKR